jgi:hypothetical protein
MTDLERLLTVAAPRVSAHDDAVQREARALAMTARDIAWPRSRTRTVRTWRARHRVALGVTAGVVVLGGIGGVAAATGGPWFWADYGDPQRVWTDVDGCTHKVIVNPAPGVAEDDPAVVAGIRALQSIDPNSLNLTVWSQRHDAAGRGPMTPGEHQSMALAESVLDAVRSQHLNVEAFTLLNEDEC